MPTVEQVAATDAGLASELRMSVMRLRRRLAGERDPGNELSISAMGVLAALYRLGEMSVGDLAVREHVRPPSMTRTVTCLEDGGHVVRRKHDDDGRQVLVALTDHGRDVLLRDRRRRDQWLNRRLAELTPDERAVLRAAAPLLERIATTP